MISIAQGSELAGKSILANAVAVICSCYTYTQGSYESSIDNKSKDSLNDDSGACFDSLINCSLSKVQGEGKSKVP